MELFARTALIAVALVLGFCLGQISYALAQTGNQPGAADVWNAIITSGPLATLLGFFLWRVDAERRQLQKERDGLLERVLLGLASVTQSTKDVAATANSLLRAFESLTEVVRDKGK